MIVPRVPGFSARGGRAARASVRRSRSAPIQILIAGFLIALAAAAAPPETRAQFRRLETENLRLLYDELNLGYLAPHTARCFENSLRFHRTLFGYDPSEKVTVILHDLGDYGNAGAGAVPRNSLMMSVAPTSMVFETYPANERINTLMNHEMVHITALDQAAGADRRFRSLFLGKVKETSDHPETILYGWLTTPRFASPRWYHEGLAVFLETWMAGGIGRAQGAYDEMVFRAMVRDGATIYDPLGLESEGTQADFQAGVNSYLYGTRFMNWLALTRSPEHIVRWAARTPGSRRHYARQFEAVFGSPMGEAWNEWIAWERAFQAANLDSIRSHPVTAFTPISSRSLGSVSRMIADREADVLYAAVNYPGEVPHLAAIALRDGGVRKLVEIKGGALYFVSSIAFDSETRTLFYTADNNDRRDLMALDLRTGRPRLLMKDCRIGDLAFHRGDRSLWGLRHMNGIVTVVRVPEPWREWNQLVSFPYGRVPYDLDLSPDGSRLAASVGEVDGRQTLRLFDTAALAAGDTTSATLHDFGSALPEGFAFSLDGRRLYGSSYYTGVSNIFRYDLTTGVMDATTNAETGFFRPTHLGGDSLVVLSFTGDGFVPGRVAARPLTDLSAVRFLGAEVAAQHPVVRSWRIPPPSSIDLEALGRTEGSYRPLQGVGLASAYPVVEGYKDYPAYGYAVNFSDPVSFVTLEATAGYTPNSGLPADERFHGRLSASRYNLSAEARYNAADFYDLFGPTKTSRKGHSLGLRYHRYLLFDRPREMDYVLSVTGYGGLERLPDYQNVNASYDKLLSAGARLGYKNLRASIGAVDHEKGNRWSLAAHGNLVNGKAHPLLQGSFDAGFPLLLSHSSLWLRTAAGWSPGDRDEPFANFYLGGFGNNWVDYQEPKRYRDALSFPGVELNAVGGTSFTRLLVDWNLPPLRFRRLGIPSFYATWARMSVFSTGLATNVDSPDDRIAVGNVGAQVDVRITLLSHLRLTVSGGYARAFDIEQGKKFGVFGVDDADRPRAASDEVMVSVKIL